MYVTPDQLIEAVKASQEAGKVNDDLTAILINMADGLGKRFRFDGKEIIADVYITVQNNLHTIDTRLNVFNYLTTVIRSQFLKFIRTEAKHTHQRYELNIDTLY